MRALLLAAGMGTRLRPLTDTTPKCLVPVYGRPLMEYWFRLLTQAGIAEILVNTHYKSKIVEDYIRNSPWRDLVTIAHETELLGTGGTILKNADFFKREPFIMAHADNLTVFDVEGFICRHRQRPEGTVITMMTFETPTPESCGIVELDSRGVVQRFHEKVENPPGRLANGAIYILEPQIIDYMKSFNREFVDFSTEVLPHFMGKIHTFHNTIYHRDIGTMESWQQANKDFPVSYFL